VTKGKKKEEEEDKKQMKNGKTDIDTTSLKSCPYYFFLVTFFSVFSLLLFILLPVLVATYSRLSYFACSFILAQCLVLHFFFSFLDERGVPEGWRFLFSSLFFFLSFLVYLLFFSSFPFLFIFSSSLTSWYSVLFGLYTL